ncbi:MAG TPA: hypothetical protein EYQ64_03460 [Gemmatimonadetes bacterium]|nr:hypothetical protein [Gemmatimonadota bacterium]
MPTTIISKRYAQPAFVSLFATAAIFISACGGGGDSASSDTTAAPPVVAEPEEVAVEIDLLEYVVEMNAVQPSGEVVLRITNRGFEEHNLLFVFVESDSTIWETDSRLGPGERRSVPLTLDPGAYKAVCDFSGHEGRGMFAEFVARAPSAESGT